MKIAYVLGLFTVLAVITTSQATERPPNIVILYADDAGWVDFGCQEGVPEPFDTLTPNIDALAEAGVRCRQAYMSGVVCSPSRAGLLTGRYQQRFGHENNIPPGYMKGGMDLAQRTIADHLGDLGYRTGLIGKWHLGYPEGYQPNDRGFDEFTGLLQGARRYHPIPNVSAHRVIQHNGTPLPESGYVTDRFGEAACSFIADNRDEPFFLFVSFTAPHGPLEPRHEDAEKLSELGIEKQRRRKYAGLIHSLDENVGRITKALDSAGLAESTLVIFTNDNGGQTLTGADNGPLRGRKGTMYEGGSRVPMIFRWPGHLPAGTQCDSPVSALDYLPTFMAIAGGTLDAAATDGIDIMPLLRGEVTEPATRRFFWRKGGSAGNVAMRDGKWKLVWRRGDDAAPELYNLPSDLGEATDRAADEPERVRAMLGAIAEWETELIEPLWGPGSTPDAPATDQP